MSMDDLNLYREKLGKAPLTLEDMEEIVRILREDRVGSSIASQKASKKKTPNKELDELFEEN